MQKPLQSGPLLCLFYLWASHRGSDPQTPTLPNKSILQRPLGKCALAHTILSKAVGFSRSILIFFCKHCHVKSTDMLKEIWIRWNGLLQSRWKLSEGSQGKLIMKNTQRLITIGVHTPVESIFNRTRECKLLRLSISNLLGERTPVTSLP
jgi:hypothetical protein